VQIAGAHLLVHALVGSDGLGTPGFRDFGTVGGRNGLWWDDTHAQFQAGAASDGAYALDSATGREAHVRYSGYVDDKMKERTRSLRQLEEKGKILNLADAPNDVAREEPMFTDPWETPILYYRATPGSNRMIGKQGAAGIYWQEDNAIITGTEETTLSVGAMEGLDFGPGKVAGADGTLRYHGISRALGPDPITKVVDILNTANYADSFARYILDTATQARPTPVRPNEYLLISAGPDARYGTEDDVTNWTRSKE
jgi:hypothetical protein